MKRLLLLPILVMSSFGFGQVVDQFTYTGALNANGWSTHSGTAGQIVVSTTPSDNGASLQYSGFAAPTGNRILMSETFSEDVNHAISGITNVGYMSFLLKVTNTSDLATGDYFIGFGGPSANPLVARTFIRLGTTANTFQLGIQNTTTGTPTQTYFSQDFPIGVTVLVVLKYDNSVSPQEASLWVNPVIGGTEPTADAFNASGTSSSFNNFATVYLRNGGNTGNLEIDEIRAGSTWADVTPTGPIVCAPTTSTINIAACESYTVPSGDEMYTASGTYMDTIPNAANCDSIITINLTIKNNTTSTINPTACGSYTVPSGDEMYTTSGTYMDTIPNAAGCDSILTINLTITASITYYADTDNDGLGDPNVSQVGCAPIAGYVTNSDDCDDTDNTIGVGATYYQDSDNDGFGNPAVTQVACTQPTGYVLDNTDCDDTDNTIGAGDMYYVDADNDGYGDANATGVSSCTPVAGSVTNNTDCNDSDAGINPGATEIPDNGIDEDCSGADLNTIGNQMGLYEFTGNACATPMTSVTTQPADATFSDYAASGSMTCGAGADVFNYSGLNTTSIVDTTQYYGFSITPDNCIGMDLNRIIFTHKTSGTGGTPIVHLRSSLDNFTTDIATKQLASSNYQTDTINLGAAFDNVTSTITFHWIVTDIGSATATYRHDNVKVYGFTTALPQQTYYADADNDGFGDPAVMVSDCIQPAGYVSDNTDCNDNDANEHPGAIWFADTDNDGLGDAGNTLTQCTQPTGYVTDSTDCNDSDNQIGAAIMYYVDADSDGYGDAMDNGTLSCTPVSGSVTNADDCDDTDSAVNPGATEVCDGIDNNCDGQTDEGFTQTTYFEDADNDGFGNPNATVTDCTQPTGYVTDSTDCDDTNNLIHPGASDQTGNGIDENCDGVDGVLGLNEAFFADLNVYPNPGTTAVTITTSTVLDNTVIEVLSVDGKKMNVNVTKSQSYEVEIETSGLVAGTYFIRIAEGTNQAVVRWVKK